MEHCYLHPEQETVLSCGICGKPICVECAQHTRQGTKCPVCTTGSELPSAKPVSGAKDKFLGGVFLTLLAAWFVPLAVFLELIFLAVFNYHKKTPQALLFSCGVALFFFMDMLMFELIISSPGFNHIKKFDQLHVSYFLAAVSLLTAVIVWNLVYRPALHISKHYLSERYGTAAGMTLASATTVTLFSFVVSALLLALA